MNLMDLLDFRFWAGTEESLHAYLTAVENLKNAGLSGPARTESSDTKEPPRLFSKQGDIGVISISGPLNNASPWVNEILGATAYSEIREALIHAATDPEVSSILLDVKSGGGAVSGVSDTSTLIKTIDAKVKPVHTYSDGMIASAAYWLGSSARSIHIGDVTEAGSVGVLTVHREMSKMLEADGITTTVLRAGEFKALGNPYEPLSDKAKGVIQAQLDQIYKTFGDHVAERRGVSYENFDKTMGQGRVFIGQAAVDAGLVDGVTTFDERVSKIQGGIDSKKQPPKYGSNFAKGIPVKNALTEQAIAAMAAGGGLTPVAEAAVQAAAALAASAAAGTEATVVVDAEKAGEVVAQAVADAEKVDNSALIAANAQVTLLTGQVSALQAGAVDAQIKLRDAQAALAPASAALEKMRPVVQKSVSNLRVALGMSGAGVETLADDALLAEQEALSAQFTSKFKVGGVAAVSPGKTDDSPASTEQSALKLARIAATRTSSK